LKSLPPVIESSAGVPEPSPLDERVMIDAGRAPRQRRLFDDDTLTVVLNAAGTAIICTDACGKIQLFNHGAEHIFGYSAGSMRGQSAQRLVPQRHYQGYLQLLQAFTQSGLSNQQMGMREIKGVCADGHEVLLECMLSKVTIRQQPLLIAGLHDVTERHQSAAKLGESRAQLRALTDKLMTQEKALVQRLAQVLHDQLGQTIAAIGLTHETIVALQGEQVPPNIAALQSHLGTLIGNAVRQVRQVLGDLRPPLLEERGLQAALDNELRNRSLALPALDIAIHVPPELAALRWPGKVEYAAFMVAREAIENSCRHSRATQLSVRFSGHEAALHLSVFDNGVGMQPGQAVPAGHLGIFGMQERAQAVGASVTFEATQPHGTCVTFHWQSPS